MRYSQFLFVFALLLTGRDALGGSFLLFDVGAGAETEVTRVGIRQQSNQQRIIGKTSTELVSDYDSPREFNLKNGPTLIRLRPNFYRIDHIHYSDGGKASFPSDLGIRIDNGKISYFGTISFDSDEDLEKKLPKLLISLCNQFPAELGTHELAIYRYQRNLKRIENPCDEQKDDA